MRRGSFLLFAPCLMLWLIASAGCSMLVPQISTMPVAHNPFPQLSKVAVIPFFNQSDEPTVDGRQFALSYFGELQGVPGFEVVPVGVVEEAMIQHDIDFSAGATAADEARRLGQVLGVDAVVVGAITDYSPYYPPRCGLHVEWYATNPGFHEIPAGYGLPWGTPDEEYISDRIAFDAELALAKAQMATQSPVCKSEPLTQPFPELTKPSSDGTLPPLPPGPTKAPTPRPLPPDPFEDDPTAKDTAGAPTEELPAPEDRPALDDTLPPVNAQPLSATIPTSAHFPTDGQEFFAHQLPAKWPDPRGFEPPGPQPFRPPCIENPDPVMTHTRVFRGHDPEFTTALAAYVDFRDDARFGGWRSYLERSDDFMRFCCHLHIVEMLEARGGVTETRVVERWSDSR